MSSFAAVFRPDVDDNWPARSPDYFFYVHTDYLGSSNLLTEGEAKTTHGGYRFVKGELVQRVEYTPFGKERFVLNASLEELPKYTGQTDDIETDLYYYGSRYYDSVLGRFIQPDSIIADAYSSQSLNGYAYVLGNPLRYNDPFGYAASERDNYKADLLGDDPTDDLAADDTQSLAESESGTIVDTRGSTSEAHQKSSFSLADYLSRIFEDSQAGAGTGARFKIKAFGVFELEAGEDFITGVKVTKNGVEQFADEKVGISIEFIGFEASYKSVNGEVDQSSEFKGIDLESLSKIEFGGTIPDPRTGNAVNGELSIHLDQIFKLREDEK